MESESADNQERGNKPAEVNPQLEELSAKLDKLIEKIGSKSKKDAWDKFGVITSFISGVLFVVVGAIYTYIYNGREKEAQANAQRQATELQTLVALSPQLSSPDSNVRKSAIAILTALKKSQPKGEEKNSEPSENSIIDSFLAQVSNKELSTVKRINAVNNLATFANNPKVPDTVKQKIENAFTSIGKFGHSEPAALKDAANATLLDILSKNNQKMVGLKPEVVQLAKQLIAVAKDSGINLIVTDGYRSPQRQDSLYNAKVSHLRGNRGGPHEKGLAFDIAVYKDGKIDWDDKAAYKKIGEIGVKLGLTWGGNGKILKNYFHFELKQ
jgi:D-alanyl-D-alanine dipeptidase